MMIEGLDKLSAQCAKQIPKTRVRMRSVIAVMVLTLPSVDRNEVRIAPEEPKHQLENIRSREGVLKGGGRQPRAQWRAYACDKKLERVK